MNNGYATLVANQFFCRWKYDVQGFHKKKSYTQILRFEKESCSFFIVPCCISTCVTRQNSNFECLKAFDVISTMIQCTYRHTTLLIIKMLLTYFRSIMLLNLFCPLNIICQMKSLVFKSANIFSKNLCK